MKTFLETSIQQIQKKNPLIHHITNYVTVNDCANVTLAIGASPIMADALEEVEEITALSEALVINMGTLNERIVSSMLLAGKKANKLNIPIIFDPVGVGASYFRNRTAQTLMKEIQFSVIRGNLSEIRFLAGQNSVTKGVDASAKDSQKDTDFQTLIDSLSLSQPHCTFVITGATDIIFNKQQLMQVKNGCAEMSRVTGTGCMLTSLIASFCGSFPTQIFEAATGAVISMGIAGELAYNKTKAQGTGSFHIALIDEISKINTQVLMERGDFVETEY